MNLENHAVKNTNQFGRLAVNVIPPSWFVGDLGSPPI